MENMDLQSALDEQARAWDYRPLVRELYSEWFRMIVSRLSSAPGASVEIGSGIGKLGEYLGDRVELTDVEQTRWAKRVVDAMALPYEDRSLANIVMLDVFHHLADPARFLDEATRTLTLGGRVVMIEPYCSPLSTPFFKRFHHERTEVTADPFAPDGSISGPMESNQARATLVFYRHRDEYERRWPAMPIREELRFSFLLYPLSGGFTRSPLVPLRLAPTLRFVERALRPLAPSLAFRCLIVLERREL
jgi:SAM-dependent methyltransferase